MLSGMLSYCKLFIYITPTWAETRDNTQT